MGKNLDEYFDEFEKYMRNETIGDSAHLALFKLAEELESKDAEKYAKIIKRCRNGHYHDFATKVATPKMDMHRDLLEVGLTDIDEKMQNGDYDS